MNYLDQDTLQNYLNKKYPNNFTALNWTIDELTMAPEMNYINKLTGEHLIVRIPSIVDIESFVENYFLETFTENRQQKIKGILNE